MTTWIKSRPDCVRKLIAEFPLGSQFMLNGIMHWLIGYNESDMLILTAIDPATDYDDATSDNNKVYLFASHVREQLAIEPRKHDPTCPMNDTDTAVKHLVDFCTCANSHRCPVTHVDCVRNCAPQRCAIAQTT